MEIEGSQNRDSVDVRFARLIAQPDDAIDLSEAALLIAQNIYPDLDVDGYLRRLHDMAQSLTSELTGAESMADRIVALNRFLFDEQGFKPNVEDYYDPRNSFLNEVLDRRLGIPISLSLVYMEVGRRIGLELQGVCFPGHFLVKCALDQGLVVIDPYSRGASLTLDDLRDRLRDVQHRDVARSSVPNYLQAARKREIIGRMLRNLQTIYTEREDYLHALPFGHWILLAMPENPAAVRDRGMTYMKLECVRAALDDLERYLELAPAANDHDEIRSHVVQLYRRAARLN